MNTSGDILKQIMARKREEVALARQKMPEPRLLEHIQQHKASRQDLLDGQGFAQSLLATVKQSKSREQGKPAIIAEIKRGSPSKGRIVPDGISFVPAQIAQSYADHGATCISCLTDRDFFMGNDAFLAEIKSEAIGQKPIKRPVLRKDFLFDPYQVVQSRALGADAILLILAVLQRDQALELEAAAQELGLDVLVEIHDEREMEAAHDLKTPLLGINNRNLKTFKTTLDTSIRLAGRAESGRLLVAESGIHTAQDIFLLQEHGIHAFLIGEAFMREEKPGDALGRLLANCQKRMLKPQEPQNVNPMRYAP